MVWPAVIAAGASILGGAQRNRAASAQSLRQMQFQERMSSTAHQREVADLRKAGLNPILSGTGGAGSSSPGGAQASVQDILTPGVNSALAARKLAQEIENLKASEALVIAQKNVIAPAAGVGEVLNDGLQNLRARGDGSLFGGFKDALMESLVRGGTSSARQAERERFRLSLRNLDVGPPKAIGSKRR